MQVFFMRGKILSGLGQAQCFLTREGYSRQFQDRLGFIPFPGTLNVLLDEPFPTERQAIQIEGFAEEGRSFGECRCYRIKLNGIDAAVVRPERSGYSPELIEIIVPLRFCRAKPSQYFPKTCQYRQINIISRAIKWKVN
jgi:riboflavin kinase